MDNMASGIALGQLRRLNMHRLISRTIQAEENVAAIVWTQDDTGKPLALEEAEIRAYFPANNTEVGTILSIPLRINGITSGYVGQGTTGAEFAYVRTNYCIAVARTVKAGEALLFTSTMQAFDGTTFSNFMRMGALPDFGKATKITNIALYCSSANQYFPTGTILEIYGREA